MALRPTRIVECLWKDVGLAARRIPRPFPRRKVLTWLLIAYLSQSIWLMPVRLLQGECWRAFPGQVVGIARCGDGVLVASACGRAGGQILLAWLGPELEVRRELRVAYPYRFATPAGLVVEKVDIWVGALCSDQLPVSRQPIGVSFMTVGSWRA
ncbi:MAG: hypothetical protein AB1446_01405 [Bacillota bacterium]